MAFSSVPSTTEYALQATAWILLLCSWAYEDVHQGHSILSAGNAKLLVSKQINRNFLIAKLVKKHTSVRYITPCRASAV